MDLCCQLRRGLEGQFMGCRVILLSVGDSPVQGAKCLRRLTLMRLRMFLLFAKKRSPQ